MGAKKSTFSTIDRDHLQSTIVDTIPAIIYIYDLETHSNVYSNQGIEQILGFSCQEILSMGSDLFQNLVHPDDLEKIQAQHLKLTTASDTEIQEIEYRMKDRHANWHHLRSYERPFRRKPDGSLLQKLGVAIDITDKILAEEELSLYVNKLDQVNKMLRMLIEHTPAPIAMFDRQMRYIAASRRYLEDYRLTVGNVIGKSHYEIFPEIPEHWKEIHQRCLSGATDRMDEDPFLRKDGSLDWIRWEIRPWYENPEQIGGIILFSEVITERKHAQQALEESEARYRNILENAPVGIAVHSGGKIVFANQAGAHMLAAETEEEIVGKPISEIIHPDGLEVAQQRIRRLLAGETGLYPTEDMYVRMDGLPIQVEVIATPLDYEGKPAIQVIVTDITERKKNQEELLQQRNRLEDLSRRLVNAHEIEQRALGRELHDQIGQMLTALSLTLDIIPLLPAEKADKKIYQAQELVHDLQKRISNLSLELRPPMLDDLGIIPALLWLINRYQDQIRFEITFRHSGVEGKRFSLETETAAYRIVQEALTNIARHAQCKHTIIQLSAVDRLLHIQIEDDGQGFDPRVALDNRQSSGLRGIRERAGLLNGEFQIESQPGKGTRIWITLPI